MPEVPAAIGVALERDLAIRINTYLEEGWSCPPEAQGLLRAAADLLVGKWGTPSSRIRLWWSPSQHLIRGGTRETVPADAEELFTRSEIGAQPDRMYSMAFLETPDDESLGRLVRQVWIEWASEQPHPKPSWLVPWEELGESDRQVDIRIGMTVFAAADAEIGRLTEELRRRTLLGKDRIATLEAILSRQSERERGETAVPTTQSEATLDRVVDLLDEGLPNDRSTIGHTDLVAAAEHLIAHGLFAQTAPPDDEGSRDQRT